MPSHEKPSNDTPEPGEQSAVDYQEELAKKEGELKPEINPFPDIFYY